MLCLSYACWHGNALPGQTFYIFAAQNELVMPAIARKLMAHPIVCALWAMLTIVRLVAAMLRIHYRRFLEEHLIHSGSDNSQEGILQHLVDRYAHLPMKCLRTVPFQACRQHLDSVHSELFRHST